MPTIVKRDGMTIEINPIPTGKLGVRKRPDGGSCNANAAVARRRTWNATRMAGSYGTSCTAIPIFAHSACRLSCTFAEKAVGSPIRNS
jgi:hypothetical protein